MKYCTKCGSPMADDDIYCAKCGAASAPIQPSPPQASAPQPTPPAPAAPTGPAQRIKGLAAKWKQMNRKKKGLLCGIAATAVIAVVLAIGLGRSNDPPPALVLRLFPLLRSSFFQLCESHQDEGGPGPAGYDRLQI